MTLKDVNELFGDRLRLAADADLQRTAMFGDEDVRVSFSYIIVASYLSYNLLYVIICTLTTTLL